MNLPVSKFAHAAAAAGVLYFSQPGALAEQAVLSPPDISPRSNIEMPTDGRVRFVPDNLFAVDFVSDSVGWAGGYYGTLLKTEDGGGHWKREPLPFTDLIRRIDFVDEAVGIAVTSRGKILRSEDGGAHWEVVHVEPGINLRDVYCLDAQTAWVVGHEATVLHTSDGGKTWQTQALSGYQGRDLPRLNGITRLEDGRLVLVGEFGLIASSIDDGLSWEVLDAPDASVTFTAVDAWRSEALISGLGGKLTMVRFGSDSDVEEGSERLEDRVPTITALSSGTDAHLFDLTLDQDGDGVIVGQGGVVRVKAGLPVSELLPLESKPGFLWYGGVSKTSEHGGYVVVGANGAVLKTEFDVSDPEPLVRW